MSAAVLHDPGSSNLIGEPYLVSVPKGFVSGSKRGVIFCHAAQESEAPWFISTNLPTKMIVGTTNGSTTINSLATFGAITDGVAIQGAGIPARTHIISHSDASTALMSNPATATAPIGSAPIVANLGGKYHQLFNAIAQAGYIVGSTFMGGDQWGNDTAVGFIETLRAHLVNDLGAADPIMMIGTSMGGLSVYCYMRAHPSHVQTAVLVCPVSDLTDSGITASFGSSINAAYGGAYSDAVYGSMHNPIQFCSLLADTPMQLWVADDDPTARPVVAVQTINAFHQADVHHMLGGHNNLNDMDISAVVAWLDSHA